MIKFYNYDDNEYVDNGGGDDDDDDGDDGDDNEYDDDDDDDDYINGNQEITGLENKYVKFKIGIFCMSYYELKTNLNKPCPCQSHPRCKQSFHSVL